MEKTMKADVSYIAVTYLKALLLAAVITGVEIIILSVLLYKTNLSESNLHIGVIVGYGIACFLSGLYCGKKIKTRRFLWGIVAGLIYYVVLLAVSVPVCGSDFSLSFVSSALVCLGSGMLGGMIS